MKTKKTKNKDDFVNTFFFGKPNPTKKERDAYDAKMKDYMRKHGFNPDTADWNDPEEVLSDHAKALKRN